MVFDPATGTYVQKQLETMTDAAPVQAASAPAAQPQAVQQNVLVYDPSTGAYVQKQMTLAFNPATGQYVPVQTEEEIKAEKEAAAAKAKADREAEAARIKAEKEAAKAEKERIAEERRARADELREEARAERARANNSVLGRIKNTAIATATRTLTNELTRGLLGTITGKRR